MKYDHYYYPSPEEWEAEESKWQDREFQDDKKYHDWKDEKLVKELKDETNTISK